VRTTPADSWGSNDLNIGQPAWIESAMRRWPGASNIAAAPGCAKVDIAYFARQVARCALYYSQDNGAEVGAAYNFVQRFHNGFAIYFCTPVHVIPFGKKSSGESHAEGNFWRPSSPPRSSHLAPETRGWRVRRFSLATRIVFVIEGVRIVPQQSAWVVERLGKFH
jgi:hypothetical protein